MKSTIHHKVKCLSFLKLNITEVPSLLFPIIYDLKREQSTKTFLVQITNNHVKVKEIISLIIVHVRVAQMNAFRVTYGLNIVNRFFSKKNLFNKIKDGSQKKRIKTVCASRTKKRLLIIHTNLTHIKDKLFSYVVVYIIYNSFIFMLLRYISRKHGHIFHNDSY